MDIKYSEEPPDRSHGSTNVETSASSASSKPTDTKTAALRRELQVTRTQLRTALAELETTRGEARATIKEYQSAHEELQAINAELDGKNQKLMRLNSGLCNLLESTRIAILFLDNNLYIKNFTPQAQALFRLRTSDRGRPITEFVSQLDYEGLAEDVHTVLERLTAIEREVTDRDGRVYIMHIRLYRTAADVIEGVVVTFFDITEHKCYERQQAWLATIVDASRNAIISEDLEGRVTSWNRAAEHIFGHESGEAMGRPLDTLLTDDVAAALPGHLERQRRTRDASPIEIGFTHPDGSVVHMAIVLSAVVDNDDQRIGTVLIAHDMTERVAGERHRRLLVRELSHRVKNVLATVQSVMFQTLEYSDSLAAFRSAFSKRLQALADTHTELLRSEWQNAHLDTLVEVTLRPYGDPAQPPWTLCGPDVELAPGQAIAVSMALHELATNAAKHGALSTDEGRVGVKWTLQPASGELEICWCERGGPPVTPPARKSFGLRLISEGLAHELDAKVDLAFEPDGLTCRIVFCRVASSTSQHNS